MRSFVESFHNTKRVQLSQTLDSESWTVTPSIPHEFQTIIDSLLQNSPMVSATGSVGISSPTPVQSYLEVSGQRFRVVNSFLIVLTLLSEYLELIQQLPQLDVEICRKLISLLKVGAGNPRVNRKVTHSFFLLFFARCIILVFSTLFSAQKPFN
jgi:hypothetical protein